MRSPTSPSETVIGTPRIPGAALCSLIATSPMFAVHIEDSPSKPCGLVTLPRKVDSSSVVGRSWQTFVLGAELEGDCPARKLGATQATLTTMATITTVRTI